MYIWMHSDTRTQNTVTSAHLQARAMLRGVRAAETVFNECVLASSSFSMYSGVHGRALLFVVCCLTIRDQNSCSE